MSEPLLVVSLMSFSGGIIIGLIMRNTRKPFGLIFGGSVSVVGFLGWLGYIGALSSYALGVTLAAGATAVAVMLYKVTGDNPRAFLILGYFLLPIIYAIVVAFPFWIIFAYVAASLAVVSALDFSRVDVASCMVHSDQRLGKSLWPFAIIESIVGRISGPSRSRPLLAAGYFLFDLTVMIVIPFAIAGILSGLFGVQEVIFVAILVFLVPLEEFHRGLERMGKNN